MAARNIEDETVRKSVLGFAVLVGLGVTALCAGVARAAQQGELPSPQEAGVKPAGRSTTELALRLINSAIEAAQGIDPASKAIVLLMAGRAVRTLWPEKAVTYLAESFQAAEDIEGSNLRLALQPMLVDQVADLDLDKAEDLIEKMDTPEITPHPDRDDRVVTAGGVIGKLLARNGPDDPDKAAGLLEYLGDTGQYPYEAASQLIGFFHRKGQDWRAADVFMRAAGYFREDDRFQGTPDKFTELIEASEGKVPASVLVSALRLCTREIKEAMTSQDTTGKDGKIGRLGGGQGLISQLRMIAEREDPQSQIELRELSVKLHNLEPNQASSRSAQGEFLRVTASETKPEEPVEVKGEVADAKEALGAVRASAAKDPGMALARAKAIQLHEYQSQALATVAKHLTGLEKAAPVLEEAERAALEADSAQEASPGEWANTMAGKVEALAEIAEAWAHWGENARASASVDKALALALDLIQKQAALRPGTPSGFESSTVLLRRVAQAEATLDPSQVAQRAQKISDPRLRAFFLISMATEILEKT